MIFNLLLSVGLSFSTPVFADDGIDMASCQTSDTKSALCLTALLTYRCGQYSFVVTPPMVLCQNAVPAFVSTFDVTQFEAKAYDGKTYKLPIIFKTKLVALIQDAKVQNFLSYLDSQLSEAARTRGGFDLYSKTLAIAGSPKVANEWLGVLFQDTSWTQWQIKYLEAFAARTRGVSPKVVAAISNLKNLVTFLEGDNLVKYQYRQWLKLYPNAPGLNEALTHSMYHFYPMAYIAQTLEASGIHKHMSFFLPFLFNTDYELREIDTKRWPFQHPLPFKLTPQLHWKMQDIYAGYTGARLGIRALKGSVSFQELSTDIAAGPAGTMRRLFWGL